MHHRRHRLAHFAAGLREEREAEEQARLGLRHVLPDAGEQRLGLAARRHRDFCIDPGNRQLAPMRHETLFEITRASPIGLERLKLHRDHGCALQHDRVVGLHIEPPPRKIGRSADHRLGHRAIDHDHLVVLQLAHVLAQHLRARSGQLRRGQAFGRMGIGLVGAVIDDDLEPPAQLDQPRDHFRQVELIGHHPDLRARLGHCRIEQVQDPVARIEPHPVIGSGRFGMGRNKPQPIIGLGRDQLLEASRAAELVRKGLG